MSEKTVGDKFDKIFSNCDKRIIIATFASNVHRVQQIIDAAAKNGRKVAVSGRSMENIVEISILLGYMKVPEGVLINLDSIKKISPESGCYNHNRLTGRTYERSYKNGVFRSTVKLK